MASVKTAISLDKSLFERLETLAREMKVTRSRLFAMAVEEFIRRHQNQQLLQELNKAYLDAPDSIEQARLGGMRRLHRKVVDDQW
jgi:metal-responsive CopG/Arc/MetJ family transcriptional regulator